ncbi:hypothetical protein DZC72_06565 [Maribacter algicola]|uniref:Uncharacterized protein n=2 Tax=Maribacter algicola TaxID=2498892 RepID=A0A426RMR1_9FLAO|nr:hypothetical protein DZC72_06565 [Maribacter algicola]
MHLSAIAHNLKKYLKFDQKRVESGVGTLAFATLAKSAHEVLLGPFEKRSKLAFPFRTDLKKAL